MGLDDLITENLIKLDMKSSEKTESILELAKIFEEERRVVNLDEYLESVFKREAEYTTGIGFGVGIPHGKSESVRKPSLCFGRSKKGINYDSMDGKPVHLLFLIAVPEDSNNEHLKILSSLSRKLMHEEIRNKLLEAETKSEILEVINN